MKFYFIRHGLSLWNEQNLCQGQTDIELSEKGRSETQVLAAQLATLPISHICSSPLKRALETATIIKQYHANAGFSVLPELSERSWGRFEGMPSHLMYEMEELDEKDLDPTVEPLEQLKSRIEKGLELAFNLSSEPLIVSHGRLFICLCDLLHIPTLRQIQNLSLFKFEKRSGQWYIEAVNPMQQSLLKIF